MIVERERPEVFEPFRLDRFPRWIFAAGEARRPAGRERGRRRR